MEQLEELNYLLSDPYFVGMGIVNKIEEKIEPMEPKNKTKWKKILGILGATTLGILALQHIYNFLDNPAVEMNRIGSQTYSGRTFGEYKEKYPYGSFLNPIEQDNYDGTGRKSKKSKGKRKKKTKKVLKDEIKKEVKQMKEEIKEEIKELPKPEQSKWKKVLKIAGTSLAIAGAIYGIYRFFKNRNMPNVPNAPPIEVRQERQPVLIMPQGEQLREDENKLEQIQHLLTPNPEVRQARFFKATEEKKRPIEDTLNFFEQLAIPQAPAPPRPKAPTRKAPILTLRQTLSYLTDLEKELNEEKKKLTPEQLDEYEYKETLKNMKRQQAIRKRIGYMTDEVKKQGIKPDPKLLSQLNEMIDLEFGINPPDISTLYDIFKKILKQYEGFDLKGLKPIEIAKKIGKIISERDLHRINIIHAELLNRLKLKTANEKEKELTKLIELINKYFVKAPVRHEFVFKSDDK